MFLKIKIINILAAVFIVLLFSNIAIEALKDDKTTIKSFYLSQEEIENKFNYSLSEWGIADEWIITKSLRKPLDSLLYSYEIKVPLSVPIPFLLNSVSEAFINEETEIFCKEKNINGITFLNIYNNEEEMLRASFKYDKEIKRESKNAAFIITDFFELDEFGQKQLLEGIDPFAAVITPNKESHLQTEKLKSYNKQFTVLLSDDIEFKKYSLGYEKDGASLKNAVRSISKDFGDAAIFLIDKHSMIYKSASFNFIKDEFGKNDILLYSLSRYILIPDKEKDEVESLFKFHFENDQLEKKIFLIDVSTFKNLRPILNKYRKRGHKFILPGAYYN